jgi:DNA-binding response OmpR family regulator
MHILIVEDDLRISQLIQRGLEESGYLTSLAYDGVSGKKIALQNDFDLIISDIMLPKMDGLEFCEAVKKQKADTSNSFRYN